MAKTRGQKEQELGDLVESIKKSKSIIFANFNGLKVKDAIQLRRKCRAAQVGCQVIKKSLIPKGLEAIQLQGLVNADIFTNGVALLMGYNDEVQPARILKEMSKGLPQPIMVYGGLLTGKDIKDKYLDQNATLRLADLPSKLELYAKIVGSMNRPISGFVGVLGGTLRGLVNVLNSLQEKKK